MVDFIKKWWKQLLIALLIITLLIIGGFQANSWNKKLIKAEKDLLDRQYQLDTIQESIRQKEFNTIIKYIEIDNEQKEKQANEIKEYIKNPNIDLFSRHIQDSISARFYYRFPQDGTSLRPANSLTN